ncbi:uncharacterized protein LOC125295253 [Alosa alosa]|uniref:uncharacterized protein LOC125295253 n=1 Tax=Alosa alosa TaxID=278164 RepID=UPI0020152CDF|nr:uncharacterized protein LOC125295253 [Alosa alosa]
MEHFFRCGFCRVVKFTIQKYLSHLLLTHQHQPNCSASCVVEQCRKKYKSVGSLRIHIYRNHRCYLQNNLVPRADNFEPESESDSDAVQDEDLEEEPVIGDSLDILLSGLKKHVALFILNLQEKHLLPKSTQDTIVTDLKCILNFFQEHYSDIVKFHLHQSGFVIEENEELDSLLSDTTLFDWTFEFVQSEYMLLQYASTNLGMVSPVQHVLGVNERGLPDTFQYVPIEALLKVILGKDDIFNNIAHGRIHEEGFISYFTDGEIFQKFPFNGDENIIRLHFYTDEYEIVNPLGSKKAIHKICAFYFSIGNIEPKYRTQLRHIHLSILVRNQLLKRYTYTDILNPLVTDLQRLYRDDFTVSHDGEFVHVRAVLATVSADNLSAHKLAGFSCSFSHGRVCRFCMIDHSDIAKKLSEEEVTIRSPEVHSYHLEALRENPGISKRTYGVVSDCPFHALEYFDVTSCFPPDVMHDILEGAVPQVLSQLFLALHKNKIISLENICNEIEAFQFGQNDKGNKPQKINITSIRSGRLPGSASERWCLFRLLPFIIGHHIPVGNPHWELYLLCRDVADIILSPSIKQSILHYLAIQIGHFLSLFSSLFPGKVTPKLHYLIHYPRLIEKFGPLRHLWCMRFEGKHQYFKRLARNAFNFKNICLTLAKRHQLRQCWELTSVDVLRQDEYTERGCSCPVRSLSQEIRLGLTQRFGAENIELEEDVLVVQKLCLDNVLYSINNILVLDVIEEDIPVFIKIRKMKKSMEKHCWA